MNSNFYIIYSTCETSIRGPQRVLAIWRVFDDGHTKIWGERTLIPAKSRKVISREVTEFAL